MFNIIYIIHITSTLIKKFKHSILKELKNLNKPSVPYRDINKFVLEFKHTKLNVFKIILYGRLRTYESIIFLNGVHRSFLKAVVRKLK